MKFECEVVRFDVSDIVTTSGAAAPTCALPMVPRPAGNADPTCVGVG